MLKMYHRHAEAGDSPAYWEEFGSEGTLGDRLRFCDVDPLGPLFLRYLKPGATMLEGGCGRGQYVAYYSARGVKVIGLDFARDWLAAIHRDAPALRLCAGDVAGLPFKAGTFDVYYSGGVVEHFEGGAERALAEARRVLKPNGVLLISVPYFSPLRHLLRLARREEWKVVAAPRVEGRSGDGASTFYQYAYTVKEFERLLAAAGLRVLSHQGYAIVWGLYDIESLQRLAGRIQGPPKGGRYASSPSYVASGFSRTSMTPAPNGHVSLLKRLLVAEDATVPGAGWLVRAGRWACANMMMYVCTPA